MAINPMQIAAGAVVGGMAGEAYQHAKDKAAEVAGQPQIEHGPVELGLMLEVMSNIEKLLHEAKAQACPPLMVPFLFPNANTYIGNGRRLDRRGYKHVSLLTSAAFTAIVRTPVGNISFNLSTGWNAFDMPDGVEVWAQGANDVKVELYYGDDSLDIPGV